eukprot:gene2286-2502_t
MSDFLAKVIFLSTGFPLSALLRAWNYWTKIDDTLLVGCAPLEFLSHPQWLKRNGVSAIINMCSEYSGPRVVYDRLGIEQLCLPTLDHHEVSLENILRALEFIKRCKSEQKRVLVHCKAGNGRAASIALCWMMLENPQKSAKVLNEELGKKRKVRPFMFQQTNIKAFDAVRRTVSHHYI